MTDEGTSGDGWGVRPGGLIAGRYRLVQRRVGGAMGMIWEAEDTSLERRVALKGLLHSGTWPDPQDPGVRRARREARALARVEHRNVVTVHDVVEEVGQVWIVMELLDSDSLADMLRKQQTLSSKYAAQITGQLLRGLTAVHGAGVVHRDVKPRNILFRPDGEALLVDFGISLFEGATKVTRTHELIGTTPYIAPELTTRAGHRPAAPTPASDMWALGITLFEMVEGRRPFGGDSDREILAGARDLPVPPMEQGGRPEPLVRALLDKEPGRRPDAATAERMLQEASRSGSTVSREDSGPAKPPRTPGRRRPRWLVPAVVAGAGLVFAGAWWLRGELGEPGERGPDGKPGERAYDYAYRDARDGAPLRVGVKADQPGLSTETATDGEYIGFEADLAHLVADEMGYGPDEVEFRTVTTATRDDMLADDKVDIVLATYSIRDNARSDFVGPYFEAMEALLLKGQKYTTVDAIRQSPTSKICTTRESKYDEKWFEELDLKPSKRVAKDTFVECAEELDRRGSDVDAVATEDVVANGYARAKSWRGTWKAHSIRKDGEGYGIAVAQDGGHDTGLLREDLCHALKDVKKQPEWKEIHDEHLGPDVGPPLRRLTPDHGCDG